MAAIFISYRRQDSRADAGRLTNDLKDHLDDKQIFRDIDTVEPGMDFIETINAAVGSSKALLAIIGPGWLTITDDQGRRRLDDPNDYVRLEIEAALQRDIRVIPVLVGDATMPREADLPVSISALARRQAHELSENRWDFDVEQLAGALARIPGIKQRKPMRAEASSAESPARGRRVGVFLGAAVLSFLGLIFLLAGVIEAQGQAFLFAAPLLGGAYWLFSKR